ncbi:hypothetical protein N5D66_26130 [Delftia tsuruhatensis]|uniref:hypothetical protein n=1 Tax=Delftia tsuruhatensis TaxID=180282 RepID=UPI00244CC70E|nr:hypothetical protein [Delftia tsuruhatensis]MDH0851434.1 hypothetical protein [Delftia tsuruhatensis]
MTTAPTPSRADALICEYRASMHPEILRAWASDAVDELGRLQAENERLLAQTHKLEMDALDLASENSILKRTETEELEARKPLPLSDDDRLRLRSDVARAIWDVMREHEDRCGHALEDVEPKHQVWDCADAAIRAVHGITGGSS